MGLHTARHGAVACLVPNVGEIVERGALLDHLERLRAAECVEKEDSVGCQGVEDRLEVVQ